MDKRIFSANKKTDNGGQQAAWFISKPLSSGSDLPTGTITYLFTDIEGSTPHWEHHPELMEASLKLHNEILFDAISKNGGKLFKLVGDEFQAAFRTAPEALSAAIDVQAGLRDAVWNELGPIKSRVGLHTGEAHLDDIGDEYAVSPTKNRVGRIRSAAHGGQILLSRESANLCETTLPDGVSLRYLGEYQMKGLTRLEPIYQLVVPGLPEDFPPLATLTAPKNNLPLELTSFIGREKESEAIITLLSEHRLVTLTGVGGTGKTRLALRAASEVLDSFQNGAWLVELAQLADPAMVPKTVATALGLVEIPGKSFLDRLMDYLEDKHLLLVLDNCEHLLAACVRLVDRLLHACPKVTILATSREILGVMGEMPFLVPPLSMPDEHSDLSVDTLCECDAVTMFVERARVVSPGFELSNENAATVVEIVRRLDGIPLAIELAAARMRLLGVEQIAQRLNDAFRLLTGGSRTVLPRHQALRASIDWSYNLLSEAERALLRRLSVFAGSWTLSAAEAVCADEPDADQSIYQEDVLDLLTELVDKSLVSTVSTVEGRNRFRMLETVRQYAHEKLVNAGDAENLRTRHLGYYVKLAENLEPKLRGKEQIKTLNRLDQELENIRLALEWGLQTDIEAELRLAAALMWFWEMHYHWSEAIDWLEKGLELELATRPVLLKEQQFHQTPRALIRAKALMTQGLQRNELFDFPNAKPVLEESLGIFRQARVQDNRDMAFALLFLGYVSAAVSPEKYCVLKSYVDEAMCIFSKIDDRHGIAASLGMMGWAEINPVNKGKIHQEHLAIAEESGDNYEIGWALLNIGHAAYINGEYAKARDAFEMCRDHQGLINNKANEATTNLFSGRASLSLGDLRDAEKSIESGLALSLEYGHGVLFIIAKILKYMLLIAEGMNVQAEEVMKEAWPAYVKSDNKNIMAYELCTRSQLAHLHNDFVQARQYAEEALDCIDLEEPNLKNTINMMAGLELGHLALREGNMNQAGSLIREVVRSLNNSRDRQLLPLPLDATAYLALREGYPERAARLYGTRWARGAYHLLSPGEREQRDKDIAEIRQSLGDERCEELIAEGQAMSLDEAVACALEEPDHQG